MNAAEFRCLLFSLHRKRSAELSLDVLIDEFREMAIKKPLVDPRFYPWIVQAGLDLPYYPAELESVASLDRFEDLPGRNAEEFLLSLKRNL